MKAIILARVSDKKQDSNAAQLGRILDYVKYKELEVWKTCEIEESSTKGDRKKFQEIVKEISKSKEPIALVVDTVDRLQRSFKESVQLDDLRKSGKIAIHFYRENLVLHKDSNSADLLRWDMAVMFARSYVLQLSDNVKRKIDERLKRGEWVGKAPIGYLNIGIEKNHKNIVPDTATADLVKKIFELYASGNYSIVTLHKLITKRGLTSKTTRPLAVSHIEHVLKNPFYYGVMRTKGRLFPHKYEPLISKGLFDKCNEILNGWGKKPFKYAAKPFVLRGLIRCAICDCSMSPEIKKGKYVYYSCSNARKAICDKKIYVPERELLKPIYRILDAFKGIPQPTIDAIVEKLKESGEARDLFHQNALETLKQEHKSIQIRMHRLADYLLDGTVTKDVYNDKSNEYTNRLVEIDEQLQVHEKADPSYYITAAAVLNLAKRALSIFDSSEVEEKRAFLNFILQNCTAHGKKLLFSMKSPFDHILTFTKQPIVCPSLDAFRTLDWEVIAEDLKKYQDQVLIEDPDSQNHLAAHAFAAQAVDPPSKAA